VRHRKYVTERTGLTCFLVMGIFGLILPQLSVLADFGSGRKVVLSFDDGWKNQYDEALPILRECGFKASFGVITDYIGLDRGTFWSRMNVNELKELQGYGMDIACHTKTHSHMLNLTQDKLLDEIIASKNILTRLGFNVKTFVYPYGEWNLTVIGYVEEAGYICARALKPEAYRLESPDPNERYHIGSYPITDQSLVEFEKILSQSTENEAVVLTYHFISDEGPRETSTPVQNFYEQMTYLRENDFEVVLLPELFMSNEEPSWEISHFIMVLAIGGLAAIFMMILLYSSRAKI